MTTEIGFYRAVGKYSFLSNLYRRPIMFHDRWSDPPGGLSEFRSAEDAYQYGKPRRPEVARWLIAAPTPHLCALAAHALFVYDVNANWNDMKVERMRRVLLAKFSQHDDLRSALLLTGDAALIEESKMDAFWGLGAKGLGKNMLGVLLMETREALRRKPLA